MGETTNIPWTDSTWNPYVGCKPVSPGCDNCYARTMTERFGGNFSQVHRTAPPTFRLPLRLQRQVQRGKLIVGHKVFVCSMSDFFIRQADEWREEAWAIMLRCPDLIFQILTKRPRRMAAWATTHPWPAHIWAGVSVESARYMPRIQVLARVPAKVRLVSFEPLLEELRYLLYYQFMCACRKTPCECKGLAFQWAIIGGESGPNARPMEMEWLEGIVQQCRHLEVSVYVKQDSGRLPGRQGRIPNELWDIKETPWNYTPL